VSEGHTNVVDLYSVCVGMAIASGTIREYLKGKDKLFADIHAKEGEELECLLRRLLGNQPERDAQGRIIVNGNRYSHVYQALMHRLKCIGGFASLRLEQQRADLEWRARYAAMLSRLTQRDQELLSLGKPVRRSRDEQETEHRNGSLTLGDGRPSDVTDTKA
jgi:hypothetical protein